MGSDAAFLTPSLFGFLLILFRSVALCSAAPLFGMTAVPRRMRMAIALALAFAAFAGAGFPVFAPRGSTGMGALIAAAAVETALGLVAGLCARFAMSAAQAGGQVISVAMGLSYGSVLDPIHGADSTAIAELLSMFSLAAMLAAGVHREAIVWLCRSVISVPPGAPIEMRALAGAVVSQAISATALAVRMAFPVLVAVVFGHVALGVISRTVPQLSVNSIGFSVTILAGGGALYMMAPSIAELAARTAAASFTGGM
ncbi:MAG TPA: flagellar biosynthetic protein FliR [Polyangia bacterium]|nr:flagellar biosynthetic protein FliR [Polyangia bacterium]